MPLVEETVLERSVIVCIYRSWRTVMKCNIRNGMGKILFDPVACKLYFPLPTRSTIEQWVKNMLDHYYVFVNVFS